MFDTGVAGLGDNRGAKLLWLFAACPVILGCGNEPVVAVGARLERSNLDSGASVTSVVTSLEKNSSTAWNIKTKYIDNQLFILKLIQVANIKDKTLYKYRWINPKYGIIYGILNYV